MRFLFIALLLVISTTAFAQEDLWVEGYWIRGDDRLGHLSSDRWVAGHWKDGSNGLAYDNFSWRPGDDHFTTPLHVHQESLGEDWFVENWADGYDDSDFQNPYYEAEAMTFARDVASTSIRYAESERHRLQGNFHDAVIFPIEEDQWCEITVQSDNFDPHLTVINTDGRTERNENFGDWNPRVDIEAMSAGTVLVLITSQDVDARGRYRLRVRRRPGPIDSDQVEDDLRDIRRDDIRRDMRRAERAELPTVQAPITAEQTTAPAITRDASGQWVDDRGGTYSITPAGDPSLR